MGLIVTPHAKRRIRQRFGIPKRSAKRFAHRCLREGCIVPKPDGRQFVIRGDVVLVCEGVVVVTCLNRARRDDQFSNIEYGGV